MMPFPNSGSNVDCTFLQMSQHDSMETQGPCGGRRTFTFSFILPSNLPFDTCSREHKSSHELQYGHFQLPPSIEYRTDKFCPKMCGIVYYIYARVNLADGGVLHAKERIQILPEYPEKPPRLWNEDRDIQLSDTTILRTALWTAKMGRVTLNTHELNALYLPVNSRDERLTVSAMPLQLRFDSFDTKAKMPQDCQVRIVLEAVTYYTAFPMVELPTETNLQREIDGQTFRTIVCLWRNKVCLNWLPRDREGQESHYASIVAPISIPRDLLVIPTFYHCYVAREYFLRIGLALGGSRSLQLKVPLQIYNSLDY